MDSSKVLFLQKNFEAHTSITFKQMWKSKDFADVTLTTMDNKTINVHRVILASASGFFRKHLIQYPNQNPLFLNGVNFKYLKLILKFIYLGQSEVSRNDLEAFLATGKCLEVNGLIDGIDSNVDISEMEANDGNKTKYNKDYKVSLMFECDLCDYKANQNSYLSEHKKSKHEGIQFICEKCGFKTARKSHLQEHKKVRHEGKDFVCDICDSRQLSLRYLAMHIKVKHEGFRQRCDQIDCNYTSSSMAALRLHIQRDHEGVKHQCDKCNLVTTSKTLLKKHKQALHEKVEYLCKYCDFVTSWDNSLLIHIKKCHN